MQNLLKSLCVGAAAALFGVALTVPSTAYDPYKGPRGHYNSVAGFARDINGTPCGMHCTRAAHHRWGRYEAHRHWRAYYPAR